MEQELGTINKELKDQEGKYKMFICKILSPEGREGKAIFYIDIYKKCKFFFTEAQNKRFRQAGLRDNSIVACLDDFHPHGTGVNIGEHSFMRKGFGQKIFNQIILWVIEEGAEMVFLDSTSIHMNNFVLKNNFLPANRMKNKWYKILVNN